MRQQLKTRVGQLEIEWTEPEENKPTLFVGAFLNGRPITEAEADAIIDDMINAGS